MTMQSTNSTNNWIAYYDEPDGECKPHVANGLVGAQAPSAGWTRSAALIPAAGRSASGAPGGRRRHFSVTVPLCARVAQTTPFERALTDAV
jgi:hypothetical protein